MRGRESLLPKDWFEKGAKDLKRVEALLALDDLEGAGFHLQQAAEKYLKGYLLGQGWQLKRTHDLEDRSEKGEDVSGCDTLAQVETLSR